MKKSILYLLLKLKMYLYSLILLIIIYLFIQNLFLYSYLKQEQKIKIKMIETNVDSSLLNYYVYGTIFRPLGYFYKTDILILKTYHKYETIIQQFRETVIDLHGDYYIIYNKNKFKVKFIDSGKKYIGLEDHYQKKYFIVLDKNKKNHLETMSILLKENDFYNHKYLEISSGNDLYAWSKCQNYLSKDGINICYDNFLFNKSSYFKRCHIDERFHKFDYRKCRFSYPYKELKSVYLY